MYIFDNIFKKVYTFDNIFKKMYIFDNTPMENAYLNRLLPINKVNIGIDVINHSTLIVDIFPIYINRSSND